MLPATIAEPETRHRVCWYSRQTPHIPPDLGFHTIANGQLLFCAHPMWFPVVGYQFDVRSCGACDYFKAVRSISAAQEFTTEFQPYCSEPLHTLTAPIPGRSIKQF